MSGGNDQKTIRTVLADDYRLLRCAIRRLIDSFPGISVAAEAGSDRALLEIISEECPHVAVVAARMVWASEASLLSRIRTACPETRIILLSPYCSDAYVRKVIAEGACGLVHQHALPDDLATAIRQAACGERFVIPAPNFVEVFGPDSGSAPGPLTPRQQQVLRLFAQGYRSKGIAEKLGISVKTVDAHRAELTRRLGIQHPAELVQEAIRRGLISVRQTTAAGK